MKRIPKKLKGLSLIEVVASIGVFSLMMVAVAGIFSSSISSSRANRVVERNLENAQFVMNEMAKELRTSTVFGTVLDGTFTSGEDTFASPLVGSKIRFYDYSQSLCLEYQYDNSNGATAIRKRSNTLGTFVADTLDADCVSALSTAPWTAMSPTPGYTSPSFMVVKSSDGGGNSANARVGRVTMIFVVKATATAPQSVTLQTTVSLRDYANSGIIQ